MNIGLAKHPVAFLGKKVSLKNKSQTLPKKLLEDAWQSLFQAAIYIEGETR